MADEELKAEPERLRAENEQLKNKGVRGLSLKVSEKGGLSLYRVGRLPVALYKEQWRKISSVRSMPSSSIETIYERHRQASQVDAVPGIALFATGSLPKEVRMTLSRGHTPRKRSTDARFANTAPVFAALGDTTRLQIVARLSDGGPLSIVRLTEGTKVSRQTITKHLRALEGAGLVSSCRAGRERIWELQATRLTEARHHLDKTSDQWDAALDRLRTLVGEEKP
jgi:DNA-binding transcriptional ArsR family regulator